MKQLGTPWRAWTWLYTNYAREVTAGIALLVVVGFAATIVNGNAIGRSNAARLADDRTNAITACENANESRRAASTLWDFVIDLAGKGANPQEAAYLEQVRTWIDTKVYQPHDCSDLSKKYEVPPPPSIPALPAA